MSPSSLYIAQDFDTNQDDNEYNCEMKNNHLWLWQLAACRKSGPAHRNCLLLQSRLPYYRRQRPDRNSGQKTRQAENNRVKYDLGRICCNRTTRYQAELVIFDTSKLDLMDSFWLKVHIDIWERITTRPERAKVDRKGWCYQRKRDLEERKKETKGKKNKRVGLCADDSEMELECVTSTSPWSMT